MSRGTKLSLDCMLERTTALTGISKLSAQRIVQERKKTMDRAATAKATPKVLLDDSDQGGVRRPMASMYSINKF